MLVKVIKSQPDIRKGLEQDHIDHLIGNIFEVLDYDTEDDSVTVCDSSFSGKIVLNEKEYKIISE
ncbi:hypothetical protein FDF40_03695 [Clostridium sporogenes]|uniref:hypothetical protein n=1 Tax=Bacillota TaxID=1239 RepID=UPI0011BEC5F2|nr:MULTISPECIES: hypothetical protein [Bacillota]NFT30580.1 hypothetical protein [Clostridium sporogenes]GIN25539.1 hypothetical protein J31TS2_21190 [Bacillus licheniformis]GIN29722.1 hypothetical protein J2TS5_17610 [Bacillus licheniformis]